MTEPESRILGRIEGKLDALAATVHQNHQEQRETNRSTNERLGLLENWRSKLIGLSAAVSAGVALLFKLL